MQEAPSTSSKSSPDATIWDALDDWAPQLLEWQRVLLRAAIHGSGDQPDAISEAYTRFKLEHGLEEGSAPELKFDLKDVSSVTGRSQIEGAPNIKLISVNNLENVNALPSGASLPFGSNLTVIYGNNGAGKSGFFRFLAKACFSRGKHNLLSNVFMDSTAMPKGKVRIEVTEGEPEDIELDGEIDDPRLKRFTVFDSTVARAHLTDSNPLGFQPSGFDVFEKMKVATEAISRELQADIDRRKRENPFKDTFSDHSPIRDLVRELGPKTDILALNRLATFEEKESSRLAELDQSIAELRAQSPANMIGRLRDVLRHLDDMWSQLRILVDDLGEAGGQRGRGLLAALNVALSEQARDGLGEIGHPALKLTGSPQWFEFIDQAKKFSELEEPEFPRIDDPCPLCHRPLDEPSSSLIRRFWGLLGHDKRLAAESANHAVTSEVKRLKALETELASEGSARRESMAGSAPELLSWAEKISHQLAARTAAIIAGLEAGEPAEIPVAPLDVSIVELETIKSSLNQKLADLEAGEIEKTINPLIEERRILRHREILTANIKLIREYIYDRKWADQAESAGRTLNARYATTKGTALFKELIEGDYRTRLESECIALDCSLQFEPKLSGSGGRTLKKLQVETGHKTVEIFSEGEQKALALADFLTEVNLNPSAAGIILDDPVTSLDHKRKGLIAKRLAEEARHRQVIIFTHDLVFLSALIEAAKRSDVETLTHWVQRQGKAPGVVSFNESPATSEAYKTAKIAEERLAEAKNLAGKAQIEKLKSGAGALREALEFNVANRLLNRVVVRWQEPISIMKMRSINWRQEVVDEIVDLFEDISRLIEGHASSDEYVGGMPTPEDLMKLINRFNAVRKSITPLQ